MNVKQMHIELDQSLQQVAANVTRKYLAEEKDWILNKMMNRFIQSRLRPKRDAAGNITGGWQLDQLSADSIRTLIVTSYSMVPYIDTGKSRYKCFLPHDYAYLLDDWSYAKKICSTDDELEEDAVLYIRALRQDYSPKSSAKYYETLTVEIAGETVTIPTDLPYGHTYIGYNAKPDVSFIVPFICAKGGFHWEKVDNLNYPGHYILLSTTSPSPDPGNTQVTIDGTVFTTRQDIARTYQVNPLTGTKTTNRLTPSTVVSAMHGVSFFKTSHFSPISELSGSVLYVYVDNSFTVSEVGITYVRKPLPISLSLNVNCELPEEFHQTICDLAVMYIKGRLQNGPGYELSDADFTKQVTNP